MPRPHIKEQSHDARHYRDIHSNASRFLAARPAQGRRRRQQKAGIFSRSPLLGDDTRRLQHMGEDDAIFHGRHLYLYIDDDAKRAAPSARRERAS